MADILIARCPKCRSITAAHLVVSRSQSEIGKVVVDGVRLGREVLVIKQQAVKLEKCKCGEAQS